MKDAIQIYLLSNRSVEFFSVHKLGIKTTSFAANEIFGYIRCLRVAVIVENSVFVAIARRRTRATVSSSRTTRTRASRARAPRTTRDFSGDTPAFLTKNSSRTSSSDILTLGLAPRILRLAPGLAPGLAPQISSHFLIYGACYIQYM